MHIIYQKVAGLDVHEKMVVATRMRVTEEGRLDWETKTFSTTTPELSLMHDWLQEWDSTRSSGDSKS